MNRRTFIFATVSTLALLAAKRAMALDLFKKSEKKTENFPYQLTDEEWRKKLTPEQYKILRSEGTEQSCTSPLNGVYGQGKFYCVGCGHLLFTTDSKFDSGTGWPSFYEPADEYSIGTSTDYKLGLPRTEVHCANCGGHLGHVFKDGPPPTGLRYCMNGVALDYVEEGEE